MDKNEELQKWLNDDRYVQKQELMSLYGLSHSGANSFLRKHKIKVLRQFYMGKKGTFVFYDRKKCQNARLYIANKKQEVNDCKNDYTLVSIVSLQALWNLNKDSVYSFLQRYGIKPIKKYMMGRKPILCFYDRAECERARPFINQPEQKEVEKVELMGLPEPKEQSPDIIPADTIDLFTMSELESELKQRGVELTAEVKAKINASDMPEMQHIATMLRGNAKTIAIRLSVLNEIAGQLKSTKKLSFYEKVRASFAAKEPPTPVMAESKKEEKDDLKTMQLTTEQKKVFCIIKEMASSGSVEIRQSAVAKKLSSKYNIGYAGARVAVSRAVKNMEIKGYVVKPSFGAVLIRAEYIGADIVEARSTPLIKAQEKTNSIKSKYKLDLIMSRLEEISLLRKEIAELKQMMIANK